MNSELLFNGRFVVQRFPLGPLQANCYLLYDKKTSEGVLIDPGDYSEEIAQRAARRDPDIKFIINTHGHADHIAGNARFGFPVLIHELDEPCLRDPAKNLSLFAGYGPVKSPGAFRKLSDGDIVEIGDTRLGIIHTPGHTRGGISILCENILFSGDTLFFESIGRTDIPGGSHKEIIASVREKLFMLPDETTVLPGHGPQTSIGHEKRNNPFL